MSFAPSAPTSELVLYIAAHGEVLNKTLHAPAVRWFHSMPEHGCVITGTTYRTINEINRLNSIYTYSRGKEALAEYCQYINPDGDYSEKLVRVLLYNYLKKIGEIYKWFQERIAAGDITEEKITDLPATKKFNLFFQKMENILKFGGGTVADSDAELQNKIKNLTAENSEKLINKIVNFNNYFYEVRPAIDNEHFFGQVFRIKLYGEWFRLKLNEIKKQNSIVIALKKAHNMKTIKCRFMRIKKEKVFDFTLPESGVYVISNNGPEIPAELIEQERIVTNNVKSYKTDYKVKTPCFIKYYRARGVTLSSILEDMRALGFEKITIYDNSCNDAAAGEMSPMARTATPTPEGGRGRRQTRRRWRRHRRGQTNKRYMSAAA